MPSITSTREIPAVSGTIGELLAAACQRYRGRPALVRGDERRSYGELLDHGARLANALQETGLAPGAPVTAMIEDRIASLGVYVGRPAGGTGELGAAAGQPGGVRGVVAAAMFATFLYAMRTRVHAIMDTIWPLGFVAIAAVSFGLSAGHGDSGRRVLVLALTAIWGLRLGAHLRAQFRARRGQAVRLAAAAEPGQPGQVRAALHLLGAGAGHVVRVPPAAGGHVLPCAVVRGGLAGRGGVGGGVKHAEHHDCSDPTSSRCSSGRGSNPRCRGACSWLRVCTR